MSRKSMMALLAATAVVGLANCKLVSYDIERTQVSSHHEFFEKRLEAANVSTNKIVPIDINFSQSPYIYTGNFSFGSQKKMARLRFTITTDWTMVTSADCYRCVSRAFNATQSTSAAPGQYFKPDHDIEQLKYAGNSMQDTVCTGAGGKND